MEREQLEEMAPIDYVVLEWPKQQPVGDAAPLILDAVDRVMGREHALSGWSA